MPEDAQAIIKLQNELDKQEQALQRANPELFAQIKAVEEVQYNSVKAGHSLGACFLQTDKANLQ